MANPTISKPWFQQRTVILFILSAVSGLAPLIDSILAMNPPLVDDRWGKVLTSLSVFLASLGTLTARFAGVESAREVARADDATKHLVK